MRIFVYLVLSISSHLLLAQVTFAESNVFSKQQSDILGTSFEITVISDSESSIAAAEAAALSEINRLASLLSTYDSDSEISRLNSTHDIRASEELLTVLDACETYRNETKNALSCRLGGLIARWGVAEDEQTAPATSEMRLMAGKAKRSVLTLDMDGGKVVKAEDLILNVDALAKGYIIDRTLAAAKEAAPEANGILIDIGGDIKLTGKGPHDGRWQLQAGKGATADMVSVTDGAVATSGQGHRDRVIAGESYGHILSPKDGWPVVEIAEATVFAPNAMQADAMATALMVMSIGDSLRWVDGLDGVEAKIVAKDGIVHTSAGWSDLRMAVTNSAATELNWPSGYEYSVSLNIPKMDVANYERPYVAIWIADKDRNLIRTLLLAGNEPRWMEENYYWHRRFGRKSGSIVDAVSEPTRRPGDYELIWDGRDHNGHVVPDGSYILHVEAAREHGGHQHDSLSFDLASKAFSMEIEPGDELGLVTLKFGPA